MNSFWIKIRKLKIYLAVKERPSESSAKNLSNHAFFKLLSKVTLVGGPIWQNFFGRNPRNLHFWQLFFQLVDLGIQVRDYAVTRDVAKLLATTMIGSASANMH